MSRMLPGMTNPDEIWPAAVNVFGEDAPAPQIVGLRDSSGDLVDTLPVTGVANTWKMDAIRKDGYSLVRLRSGDSARWFQLISGQTVG